MRWPLGVVSIVYGDRPQARGAELAFQQGFEHFDLPADGFPFADPLGAALETAAEIRALM